MRRTWPIRLLVVAWLAAGCGSDGGTDGLPDVAADVPADVGGGGELVGPEDVVAAEDLVGPLDVPPPEDVLVPPLPFGPENRGFVELRGVVHLHSALSHDGCSPDGYEDNGGPEPTCLAELHAAPCATGIDFAMLTDHPGQVRNHTVEETLQFRADAGDVLVRDGEGRAFANLVTCPAGSPRPRAFFYAGTEGNKNMPVGLAGEVPDEVYDSNYGDSAPLDVAQRGLVAAHALGGFGFAVHTEQSDISAERIQAIPLDGMEIYNLHANLMAAIARIDLLFRLDRFMGPADAGPPPDLSMLLFLEPLAPSLTKFDAITPNLRLTGFAATDVHRNVELPILCPYGIDSGLCENMQKDYPNFAAFLVDGGPVPLSDGDRIDSYQRGLRWFANRVLVPTADEANADAIRQAVGHGRGYMAFDVFGVPVGFDFFAVADGAAVEQGEEVSGAAAVTLYLRAPRLGVPPWGLPGVEDFAAAELTTRVLRATTDGVTVVAEVTGQGAALAVPVEGPGAYRVEVAIVPTHLADVLATLPDLVTKSYPYVYSNAIFVR